jgi:hypothetical protein
MAGYSGTPLVKKLGIKAASTLALVNAPSEFRGALVGMPDDVRLVRDLERPADLIICFVQSKAALTAAIPRMQRAMGGGLWMAWPKKSSGVKSDLSEDLIRAAGLAHGLVDYKVCAIDETWSGLKFARRKQ